MNWTDEAEADLVRIGDYVSADNPARAASFVNEIMDAGDAIADMPRAFPLVPRLEHRGIRKRSWRQYLIFYRVVGDEVHVLHVVHGMRDYVRVLFPDA